MLVCFKRRLYALKRLSRKQRRGRKLFGDVDGATTGRLELDFPHHAGLLATGVRLLCARRETLTSKDRDEE